MLGKKVGLDLGSVAVRVLLRGEGGVVEEPSLVAFVDGRAMAAGASAPGASQRGARLRAPMAEGRVVDQAAMEALLEHVLARVVGRQRIFRPDVMVAVASSLPGGDRRAVMEVVAGVGARTVYLVDAPLAAAIGCGLPVTAAAGHLVVNAGAGVVDVAVVAHEGAVAGRCIPCGGARLNEAVARHLLQTRGLELSETEAEEARRELGSAIPLREERTLRLTTVAGEEAVVRSGEVFEAMAPVLATLTTAVREVLDECPPTLLDDLHERDGAVLTGGCARMRGLDQHLSNATGLRVRTVEEPHLCAVRGATAALEGLDIVRRNLLYVR